MLVLVAGLVLLVAKSCEGIASLEQQKRYLEEVKSLVPQLRNELKEEEIPLDVSGIKIAVDMVSIKDIALWDKEDRRYLVNGLLHDATKIQMLGRFSEKVVQILMKIAFNVLEIAKVARPAAEWSMDGMLRVANSSRDPRGKLDFLVNFILDTVKVLVMNAP